MENQNNKPLISFILPNYNNQHVINLFFEKFIENNTYDNYEFIVCDDGSEDDGLELLYDWQKSGKINNMQVIAEPHKGIINALNKCLFAAKGDFIIRCDGDATIETKGFVEKFLDFYNINPEKIGVITSKVIADCGIIHAIGRNVISKDGLHDRGKKIREKVGTRTYDSYADPDPLLDIYIDKLAEVDSVLGVLTFCDRETAIKIGGFDENYPLWIEDDDFYLSFRLHGKKCFYLPEIEVCHRFSLRGDRNPDSWSKNKKKNKFAWIFNKKVKGTKIKYRFLGIPVFKIKEKNLRKNYYILGIKVYSKKYIGWRPTILKHDYEYWKQKWGFDILNPNMNEIKEKYKGTEILWNYDANLKNIGESIIQSYIDKHHVVDQKISILTCYHMPYWIPSTSAYTPIYLGKAIANQESKDGIMPKQDVEFMTNCMIGDDTGDNISSENRTFCETTAIYWASKNLEKLNNPDYVGLAHYRRHFIFNMNDKIKDLEKWLPDGPFYVFDKKNREYAKLIDINQNTYLTEDAIVPYLYNLKNINENYKTPRDNYISLGHKGIYYDSMVEIIKKEYPEYINALNKFNSDANIYLCNMFVMKRELFLKYSKFLFEILFKINAMVNTDDFSIHEKRGLAFLSEFILTIFLFKEQENPNFNFKEMHVSYLKDIPINCNQKRRTLLQNIFSIKNDKSRPNKIYKVITILGLKFKFKKRRK